MERLAHLFTHIGPMGWIFVGAGVDGMFRSQDWLVGCLLVAMPLLAMVRAHEERCLEPLE